MSFVALILKANTFSWALLSEIKEITHILGHRGEIATLRAKKKWNSWRKHNTCRLIIQVRIWDSLSHVREGIWEFYRFLWKNRPWKKFVQLRPISRKFAVAFPEINSLNFPQPNTRGSPAPFNLTKIIFFPDFPPKSRLCLWAELANITYASS